MRLARVFWVQVKRPSERKRLKKRGEGEERGVRDLQEELFGADGEPPRAISRHECAGSTDESMARHL